MLRILHTADWHLGHALHSLPRDLEHARFLAWLGDTIEEHDVDSLLICGDVFETINPPATALGAFYRFLADARARRPALDIVVIAGNHDSAARLEAAAPLLEAIGVRAIGNVRRFADGSLDADRLCVPLRDANGKVAAMCAAVPFLRAADLRPGEIADDQDELIEGVRDVYARVFDVLRQRRVDDQATIALGHCFMVGTELSVLSERRILGGNQHALPVDIFPGDVSYAALGHLHKAQRVGPREHVRYSGSPIPLSMGEIDYRHQVVVAEFDGPQCTEIRPVTVPRTVEFMRVPKRGFGTIDAVCAELTELAELEPGVTDALRPFLEVRVALEKPEPDLRRRIDEALDGRAPRLVKLTTQRTGHGRSLAEQAPPDRDLGDLEPEAVFRQAYARAHSGDPDTELLDEFAALLEDVRGEDAT